MEDKIKYLFMDVDGTLTDGKIYMGNSGEIAKAFSAKDGCGIHDLLIPSGITPVIITGRFSRILEKRCEEIGIVELYQNVSNKSIKLEQWLLDKQVKYNNVAYIGDDINDLMAMLLIKKEGGVIGCPADSIKDVALIADYVCDQKGGEGAVREFIEWLIARNMK